MVSRPFNIKFEGNPPFSEGRIMVWADDIDEAMKITRADLPIKKIIFIGDGVGIS
jgi:hypothetical protein